MLTRCNYVHVNTFSRILLQGKEGLSTFFFYFLAPCHSVNTLFCNILRGFFLSFPQLLTLRASFVDAAPPGKILSIFIMGWTLDSIPPEILIPVNTHGNNKIMN